MTSLNEELIDLQTRLAYQEDTLSQLNDVVTKQDADILQLQQQLRLLAKRIDELSYAADNVNGEIVANERPPHY